MITISEITSFKCPGETSLRIDFEYNEKIIEILKQTECALWHKTQKFWEVHASKLSFLIDNFTFLDDIKINLLKEKENNNYKSTLKYKSKLFNYQQEGINFLLNNENCLLLDEPGLGKSLQTISFRFIFFFIHWKMFSI